MWPLSKDADIYLDEQYNSLPTEEVKNGSEIKPYSRESGCSSGDDYLLYVLGLGIVLLLGTDIIIRLLSTATACYCPPIVKDRSPYLVGNGTTYELAAARDIITYSPRNLTGMYTFSAETRKLTRKKDAEAEDFGKPSYEIDAAWHTLLKHEIEPFHHLPELSRLFDDHKVYFEPEVYHVLHCLNAVREQVNRALYPETIPSPEEQEKERLEHPDFTDDWHILHTEHCMDRIRQDIMCHADMTPSLFHAIDGASIQFSNPDEKICRDWEPIRQWMESRKAVGE